MAMTYEEAKKVLDDELNIRTSGYYDHLQAGGTGDYAEEYYFDVLQVAIEAIKKQIPTSINKSWRDARGYTNTFICGKCEAHIQMPYMMNKCDYEYCPYCGNRLE